MAQSKPPANKTLNKDEMGNNGEYIEIITKYENGKEPKHFIMNGQDELVRIDLTNKPNPSLNKSPVHIMNTHKGKTAYFKRLSAPTKEVNQ